MIFPRQAGHTAQGLGCGLPVNDQKRRGQGAAEFVEKTARPAKGGPIEPRLRHRGRDITRDHPPELPAAAPDELAVLPDSYTQKNWPVARERLNLAGRRLPTYRTPSTARRDRPCPSMRRKSANPRCPERASWARHFLTESRFTPFWDVGRWPDDHVPPPVCPRVDRHEKMIRRIANLLENRRGRRRCPDALPAAGTGIPPAGGDARAWNGLREWVSRGLSMAGLVPTSRRNSASIPRAARPALRATGTSPARSPSSISSALQAPRPVAGRGAPRFRRRRHMAQPRVRPAGPACVPPHRLGLRRACRRGRIRPDDGTRTVHLWRSTKDYAAWPSAEAPVKRARTPPAACPTGFIRPIPRQRRRISSRPGPTPTSLPGATWCPPTRTSAGSTRTVSSRRTGS